MERYFTLRKKPTMNKDELIQLIAEETGLTKLQSNSALKAVFAAISKAMIQQKKIMIHGFGSFTTKIRSERKGRNPSTGKEITIPQSIVVGFKSASQLKDAINSKKVPTSHKQAKTKELELA